MFLFYRAQSDCLRLIIAVLVFDRNLTHLVHLMTWTLGRSDVDVLIQLSLLYYHHIPTKEIESFDAFCNFFIICPANLSCWGPPDIRPIVTPKLNRKHLWTICIYYLSQLLLYPSIHTISIIIKSIIQESINQNLKFTNIINKRIKN